MILLQLQQGVTGTLSEYTKDWRKDKTCVSLIKLREKRWEELLSLIEHDVCLPTKMYDPDWC